MPRRDVVGRAAEQGEVDAFLDSFTHGFAALRLEGEPGIGKTTVWQDAGARAAERGAEVLSCRPSAAEAKLSFAAVADLLAPVPDDAFATLPTPQREALDVALLRSAPSGRAPVAHAVAAGFLSLVRALASVRPLIVAVDDAQWLDPPSRGVLEFAARRLDSEPIGLLYAIRAPASTDPLARVVPEERLRRVQLGGLSLAALGRIIGGQLGRPPARPVLVRIREASDGNPFYALEIARLLRDSGAGLGPSARLPVPEDLQTITARRVRRLPADARAALQLLSVLPAPSDALVDLAVLAPAEEAGMVAVDERGRVDFTHPLFAAAVYGTVSSARRLELHREAAALSTDAEQRARHLALSSGRPDAEVAAKLDVAAALAALRGAPDTAAELEELAATRTPPEDPDARAVRRLSAVRHLMDCGDLARAERLAEEALALALDDRISAEALQLTAQLHGRRDTFGLAAEVGAAALALAGTDQRLRAEIELDLSFFRVSLGDFPGGAATARDALGHAEASNDLGLFADALAGLTVIEFLAGHGLSEAHLARALALEEPFRVRMFAMRPLCIHGMLQLWTGDLEGAVGTLDALHSEMIERGQEGVAPLISFYVVWAAVWGGDLTRADRVAAESLEATDLLEDAMASAGALTAAALVHAHDGRTDLARREAHTALGLFERLEWRAGAIWPTWALGQAELADGRPVEADAVLRPLAEQIAQMPGGDPVLAMFLPDEIEALITLGELERAERFLDGFEARALELRRPWALAAAARCRGALLAASGDGAAAFAAFDDAMELYEGLGMPLERARTLLLAGQAHRRNRQRRVARTLLTEAQAQFERAGARGWAARAADELARVGGRTPSGEELTGTEQRVADLVAYGLTNREVAERAFLSVKTVESNLTRVYRKLGVSSRAALVRSMAERNGHSPPALGDSADPALGDGDGAPHA